MQRCTFVAWQPQGVMATGTKRGLRSRLSSADACLLSGQTLNLQFHTSIGFELTETIPMQLSGRRKIF